jgi:hypothetical protein
MRSRLSPWRSRRLVGFGAGPRLPIPLGLPGEAVRLVVADGQLSGQLLIAAADHVHISRIHSMRLAVRSSWCAARCVAPDPPTPRPALAEAGDEGGEGAVHRGEPLE